MSYKKESVTWPLEHGGVRKVVGIVARNGSTIAECKTEAMADKIIKGLELVKYEEDKRKNFRI